MKYQIVQLTRDGLPSGHGVILTYPNGKRTMMLEDGKPLSRALQKDAENEAIDFISRFTQSQ